MTCPHNGHLLILQTRLMLSIMICFMSSPLSRAPFLNIKSTKYYTPTAFDVTELTECDSPCGVAFHLLQYAIASPNLLLLRFLYLYSLKSSPIKNVFSLFIIVIFSKRINSITL